MQGEKEMKVNKMRRSKESGGGRVNSIPARHASTGELLSPRLVHKPSKHKPAYFFLLNPEVTLRPDPLSRNSGFFPQWGYQQNGVKLEGLWVFFLLNGSILYAFRATFYTNLLLFLTLCSKTAKHCHQTQPNKGSCHSVRINISSSQI